ncbi:ENTH-domain-containing protein [Ascodesmis nigricans]|uniref:ENTH-domain-containing protein n=1 Tax=Ascodesmis nigricans TaxID=341454 RepID=A0A4S2N5P8_9PEZI|nr:ENTH-domain-containing protein [Ascodesmis nigricans]
MAKVLRSVKNVTKGYSNTQVKVRNATSNDPWGPTAPEMAEIAMMTFSGTTDFFEIMDMLDKRLNDKGKNWRHVLKSLKVLDYCLHEGHENVVIWAKENMFLIKTLQEFQHLDEDGLDQGMNIRVAAKDLTNLLQDDQRLQHERQDRKLWESRVGGLNGYSSSSDVYPGNTRYEQPRRLARQDSRSNHGRDHEDWEYKMALEASKNQAEEDKKKSAFQGAEPADADLAKAIKLSQEEEERRRQQSQQATEEDLLFNITPVQPAQPQVTGYPQYNYYQGQMVDFWGNPVNQQSTGYLNTLYAQPTAQFPQPTGFRTQQQGFASPMINQPTGYTNPYQNTGLQPPTFQQPGDHNPYANGLSPQQPLQPLPTGSNNPFAPKMNLNTQPRPHTSHGQPSLNSLAQQQSPPRFANNFPSPTSFSTPSPQPSKPQNPQHVQLEALLQSGNGLDTFGNTGDLRVPAQHTTSGAFVNSAGIQRGGIQMQDVNNNPFFQGSQFAGMPQSTGFGGGLQPPAAQRLVPSHTGPAQRGGNPWA